MSQTFFAMLTAIGEAKHQNAALLGQKVQYARMAVGDGNGAVPMPSRDQKKLVNQVNIAPINQAFIDPANSSQIVVEQVIPETVGGWWIREAGIFDVAGDLIAVASLPPTYKPQMQEGSGRTQVVRIVLLLTNTSTVELRIDPAVVLATRKYVDDLIFADSGVVAKTYGSETKYPTFTVDKRGRVVNAGEQTVAALFDSIPTAYKGDIVFVKGFGEMWWVDNQFYKGYRTKACGMPVQTLDRVDRSYTIALDGGTFDRTLPKFKGLYAWIQENNLLVTAAAYKDGEGFFCPAGGNFIKTPNQDNMFWRNKGTDADTANARTMATHQLDTTKRIPAHVYGLTIGGEMHTLVKSQLDVNGLTGKLGSAFMQDKSISYGCVISGDGVETRPTSTALVPRLHV